MSDVQPDVVPRVILHQCGFQGCRVGEASNPGPVVTRQGRRSQAFHDTQVDVSSDEEPLVRPITGRDVIARVEESTAGVCTDTIVDDLERDLTEQPMPGFLRAGSPTFVANRFSSFVVESDNEFNDVVPPTLPASDNAVREMLARSATPVVHITDIDSDNLSDTATDPDNVPGVVPPRRRRRLVLVPQPSGGTQQSVQDLPHNIAIDSPDSHDNRLRRVRQALQPQGNPSEVVQGSTSQMLHRQARAAQIFIQELSRRVGSVPGGQFNSPHRARTTVVSSERSSDVGSSRTGSVHTSVGMVDLHDCQFSCDQFQRRIG